MQASLLPSSSSTSLPEYPGRMATFQLDEKELSFEIIGVDIDLIRRHVRSKKPGAPNSKV